MAVSPPAIPLSARDVRRLDGNAEELGVPVTSLMANAGQAIAEAVMDHVKKGGEALLLCGKGNNGGDGLAAAVELQSLGRKAWVVLAEPPERLSRPARLFFLKLRPGSWTVWNGKPEAAWSKVTVVVDALLGIGITGAPRPPYAQMIEWLNARRQAGAEVIACDIPSGLGHKPAVRPTRTVTFHGVKEGMHDRNCGHIEVAEIGIPPAAVTDVGFGDLLVGYPVPRVDSHKGQNGILLMVAGSIPYAGAPFYSGTAAYRTGCDLVHAATSTEAAVALRGFGPHIIVHDACKGPRLTIEGLPAIRKLLQRASAVLVGPGLGDDARTRRAVAQILKDAARRDLPIVVDADALDALTPALLARHGHKMVLTPHTREFEDLAGKPATDANVQAFAAASGVTVLCKGAVRLITDGTRTRWCRRGHPTLTVGGIGDVIAGCTAALMAKGATPFDAACAASYLVGCAGEQAAAILSYGATATDVAQAIPSVLLRLS